MTSIVLQNISDIFSHANKDLVGRHVPNNISNFVSNLARSDIIILSRLTVKIQENNGVP